MTHALSDVVYPVLGLSHLTSDPADLVRHHMLGRRSITCTLAVQPNSEPHIGTVTTLMTAFSIAEHLRDTFKVPVEILLDVLENSPAAQAKVIHDGVLYQRSLADAAIDGPDVIRAVQPSYAHLVSMLTTKTGIPLRERSYNQFQSDPSVRAAALKLLANSRAAGAILSPGDGRLRFRFPCPICRYVDKAAVTLRIEHASATEAVVTSRCFEHGPHDLLITPTNASYFDTNSAIRDVLKGASYMLVNAPDVLPVLVSGGDWAVGWPLRIFCEGLALIDLPYRGVPCRMYAPVITDWSGAKFSKSLYVAQGAYAGIPAAFLDYAAFRREYGDAGLEILWEEVRGWGRESARLLRGYSLAFLQLLLDSRKVSS